MIRAADPDNNAETPNLTVLLLSVGKISDTNDPMNAAANVWILSRSS